MDGLREREREREREMNEQNVLMEKHFFLNLERENAGNQLLATIKYRCAFYRLSIRA